MTDHTLTVDHAPADHAHHQETPMKSNAPTISILASALVLAVRHGEIRDLGERSDPRPSRGEIVMTVKGMNMLKRRGR